MKRCASFSSFLPLPPLPFYNNSHRLVHGPLTPLPSSTLFPSLLSFRSLFPSPSRLKKRAAIGRKISRKAEGRYVIVPAHW
jgi:hypothetical protein